MKTIEIKIYSFEELSQEAQQKAIEELIDINVDHNWWECTYDDAERIGLEIQYFDLDRNRHAKGRFLLAASEVAQNILNEHGEECETYKTASNFMDEWQPIFNKYMETEEGEDELIEIEDEFLNSILEDYAIILQREYEYLTSKEAIIETIKANEYEFTENGKMY